ncbi:DnaD domain-containing protein [Desulfofalx alkaliphila]|uniref:DnaD domain-containing protein n=1 Tax=Desulfofalx alkaliphila TaxID=105483 RepID=UPI0004E11A76|nr:DnaD domain protein [Desulfofalx alkaliphila]
MKVKNSKAVKKYRGGNITAAFGAELLVHGTTGIPNLLLKYYKKMDLSDSEMMLLINLIRFRTNEQNLYPTVEELGQWVNGGAEKAAYLLERLLEKEIVAITQYYDYGMDAVVDGLDFEPLYEKLSELWACDKVQEIEQTENLLDKSTRNSKVISEDVPSSTLDEGQVLNICTVFEREFARPLSPIEVDRIRQWVNETDSVIIMEALRRAVLMGKNNFRYIDAIIMEWRKNNLRTLQDIARYDEEFQQRRASRGTVDFKRQQKSTGSPQGMDERKKMFDSLLMS